MVEWLRLCAPNAGVPDLIPGQGTRSHMLQLKIPHAETKDSSCPNEDPTHGNEDPACYN